MKVGFRWWRRLPRWRRLLGLALAVVSGLFVSALAGSMFDDSGLRESGTSATARVLNVHNRDGNMAYAEIRFVTESDKTVITKLDLSDGDSSLSAGDHIEIRYRQDDPKEVVVAHVNRTIYWLNRLIWFPVLGIGAGVIVARIWGWRPRRESTSGPSLN